MRVITAGFALVLADLAFLSTGISAAPSANEARLSARWDQAVKEQSHAIVTKTEARHLETRSDAAAAGGSGGKEPGDGSGRKPGVPGGAGSTKLNKKGHPYRKRGPPSGSPKASMQGAWKKNAENRRAQEARLLRPPWRPEEGSSQVPGTSALPSSATQLGSRVSTSLPGPQYSSPPSPLFSPRTSAQTSVFQPQQHRSPPTFEAQQTQAPSPPPSVPRSSHSTGFRLFGFDIPTTQAAPPSPQSSSRRSRSRSHSPNLPR